MKLGTIILTILFIFSNLISRGQNKNLALQPEFGKEYIYEFTEINYIQNKGGDKRDSLIKRKLISIRYTSSPQDDEKYLLVRVKGNTVEKPNRNITNFTDYRFPEFRDGFYDKRYPDFYEGLLCRVDFKYNFNTETNIVKLANLEQVLFDVRSILSEKGFGEDEIKERISIFIKEAIPQITKYLQTIYHVSADFIAADTHETHVYDEKLEMRDSVFTFTQKKWNLEAGLYMRNITINYAKTCLIDLHTIELDTFKHQPKIKDVKYQFSTVEKRTQLKSIDIIGLNRFVISGKIENPGVKTVTLAVLKKSFGSNMHVETVFLDENNTFKFDIELNHAGFVFLQFGKNNFIDERPVISLYAKPGSEISFEAKGESFPWDIEFSGDLTGASNFMYDFRKSTEIFHQKIDSNTIQNFKYKTNYADFIKAYNDFDSFAVKYKTLIDKTTFEFISNEMTSYFLDGVLYYLSHLNYSINSPFGTVAYPRTEGANVAELQNILNSYNIYEVYNEYGIYSRHLVSRYLRYHFAKTKKVRGLTFRGYRIAGLNSGFYYSSDITQQVELARAILTGHPLYSQLIGIFISYINQEERLRTQDKSYILQQTDKYLDLMIRVCNDTEFIDAIKNSRKNLLQWQDENFVPDTKFFNQEGEQKCFKDFFDGKPTLFYISTLWGRQRYYWDKLAEDNPELNVVMIMEGSNFKEWTNYVEASTPVAKQLLLVNDNLKLTDVFVKGSNHYIAYNSDGKFIGFGDSADEIIKMGKESLLPKKKEFDKSQLQIIVVILAAILIFLIIGLLIWKWQVRQRFIKEAQIRKLRELELTAIRSQMNPHFLFNSLNSVQNLVQQNKGHEAHLYLSDFAGLIRKVLRNSEKEEVSLAEELEMTRQYLNLEKLRFDFDFSISVDKKIDVHNTPVPSMLLQPFAENAVIHGLQSKRGKGTFKIEVNKAGNNVKATRLAVQNRLARTSGKNANGILITLEDNGIGREEAKKIAKEKNGKGIKLIQERLNILQEKQGEKYRLKIIDLQETGETGTLIEIFIPDEK